MLSKEEIEKNFQSIVDMTYTDHGCDVSVLVVHMRDQAIFAIELQAKLDAIERWANRPATEETSLLYCTVQAGIGYGAAQNIVLQILRGDE